MSELREIVNRIVTSKKTSAAAIARKMGISSQTFNSYLRGYPQMNNLLKIAEALEVDIVELVPTNKPVTNNQATSNQLASNQVNEPPVAFEKQPNNQTNMNELEKLIEENEFLKDYGKMQKEKILRLEAELKKCEESRVYAQQ